MSVDLEEQIRHLGRAFERFIDDIDADEVMHRADLRSIATAGVDDDAHQNVSRSNHDGARSAAHRIARATRPTRLPRLMTLVAACVLIGLGVAGIVLVRQRPIEPPSSTALPFSQDPAWYEALAPLLPAGYEHVAIQQSNRQYVQFEAFNPATSKTLHITVTRTPMSPDPSGSMTLAVAQDEPWTDASVDYNISLPDGRQVSLYCAFRPMPETEPGCPDVNGDHTDPEMLRLFALSLATDLDPADLPPASDELDHVSIDEIRSAIGGISTPPESADLEAPHYAFSFVQHGETTTPNFFTVRTVTGFYPPLPPDTPRTTASVGEFRLTWQPIGVNTIWYVFDSPASGLDLADEILDRATQPWGLVPTWVPDGYAIWSITSTGSSGEMRPTDPGAVNEDHEISWGVERGAADVTDPATIELDNGTTGFQFSARTLNSSPVLDGWFAEWFERSVRLTH